MPRVTINASLKKKLEAAIAIKTAQTANRIYNTIVTFDEGVGYPYYSGAYMKSWAINQTGIGGDVPQGKPDQYQVPSIKLIEPNLKNPYASWFVANSYNYAHTIEYEGTKYSDYVPWKTLHNAVTIVAFGGAGSFINPDQVLDAHFKRKYGNKF
jgi:hypothetical protein